MADLKGAPLPPAAYANLMQVSHTSREFFLTFAQSSQAAGVSDESEQAVTTAHLVSRVVTSPGHAKAIVRALEANIRRYEERFGAITEDSGEQPKHVQ
jgi:hypothetical protein